MDFDYTGASLQTQSGFSSFAAGLTDNTPQSITVGSYTVGVSGQDGFYNRGTVTNAGAFTYADLYDDVVYINNSGSSAITISITGVTPNTPYDVTLYSYDQGPNGTTSGATMTTTFSPGANTTGANGTVAFNVPNSAPTPNPTSNGQYATTLTLTGTGNMLNITATAAVTSGSVLSGNLLRVNGFELASVPEPSSSVALLTMGGVLLRRRRVA